MSRRAASTLVGQGRHTRPDSPRLLAALPHERPHYAYYRQEDYSSSSLVLAPAALSWEDLESFSVHPCLEDRRWAW